MGLGISRRSALLSVQRYYAPEARRCMRVVLLNGGIGAFIDFADGSSGWMVRADTNKRRWIPREILPD